MTDTLELERIIRESGLKKSFIANKLNISRQSFKNKCENKTAFTSVEIKKLCELLNVKKLSDKERIFFADEVI